MLQVYLIVKSIIVCTKYTVVHVMAIEIQRDDIVNPSILASEYLVYKYKHSVFLGSKNSCVKHWPKQWKLVMGIKIKSCKVIAWVWLTGKVILRVRVHVLVIDNLLATSAYVDDATRYPLYIYMYCFGVYPNKYHNYDLQNSEIPSQ